MDGLLGSEFAHFLRDSYNSTPRRHVVSPSPPPPTVTSPQKKPRGTDFGMSCNMQLEPRLQFAPIPTSPTSPLPNSKLIESPAPTSQTTGCTENSLHSRVSPASKLSLFTAPEAQLACSPVSPIAKPKHRNSDQVFRTVRKNLSSSLSDSAASRPLEFLATVSVESDLQTGFAMSGTRSASTAATSVGVLPTSPVNSEVRNSMMGEDKKKVKSPVRTSRASGKSNSTGRVFACKQCSSTFSQQFNLNKHVRAVHERRRPFECETCHARFQQKSHRTMHHLAVHEKLRQFGCDQCNASFSWRGVLKKHRKSIHGLDD